VLRNTADDLGVPGVDEFFGYGRVNARRAAEFDVAGICFADIAEPTPGYLAKGREGLTVTGSAYGDAFSRYLLEAQVRTSRRL
jgi:hypothetical protein